MLYKEMDFFRIMTRILILYANEKGYQYSFGSPQVDFQLTMPKKDWYNANLAHPIYNQEPTIPMVNILFDYRVSSGQKESQHAMNLLLKQKASELKPDDEVVDGGKSTPEKLVILCAFLRNDSKKERKENEYNLSDDAGNRLIGIDQFLSWLEKSWFGDISDDNYTLKAFQRLRNAVAKAQILTDVFSSLEHLVEACGNDTEKIKPRKTPLNSIFVGAGVSISAHLPDWMGVLENLSSELEVRYLQKNRDISDIEADSFFESGLNESGGLTRYASFLEIVANKLLSSNMKQNYFIKCLKSAVYTVAPNNYQAGKNNITITQNQKSLQKSYPFHESLQGTELLESIADMIVMASSKNLLRGVITYNYDDLLDFRLYLRNKEKYSNVQIEHCHGFLPFPEGNWHPKEDTNIILTDESYMRLLNPINNGVHDNQEKYLTESQAWLLGFSLADVDQRRLLAKVYNKNKNHYAIIFLKKHLLSRNKKSLIRIERMQYDFDIAQDVMLRNLGLVPIWINDFSELPQTFEREFKKHLK